MLEGNGILANEIKVVQGDNGIDIIATYMEKLVLIQCKDMVSSIRVSLVRDFESAISRYPSDSLGTIVYNGEKVGKNYATPKAKQWVATSKTNIIICEKEKLIHTIKNFFKDDEVDGDIEMLDVKASKLDIGGLVGENVSIGKIISRKRKRA